MYGILPGKHGNLWLSTNKGLPRFNRQTSTLFRNYDLRDGLQGNEFDQGSHFAAADGELFFGGIHGVKCFLSRQHQGVNKLLEIERIQSSIATDLHDDIGSALTEIALFSDVGLRELKGKKIQQSLDGGVAKVESLLQKIGSTSRGLIDAMNDIVWAVDPKNDSFEFLLCG